MRSKNLPAKDKSVISKEMTFICSKMFEALSFISDFAYIISMLLDSVFLLLLHEEKQHRQKNITNALGTVFFFMFFIVIKILY
jgi:TRAP-type mannitol/chloroaromatic compound transport system permease small subunit